MKQIDDVELDEFVDEIDEWVIDALKSIGCDTARSVLRLTVDELVRRADLEEDTAREVIRILEAELEDE
jgi:N utilization substance protein A